MITSLETIHGEARLIARFDPMEELVSCILSQHTSDANSFPTFTRLRARFPEWSAIAALPAGDLAQEIQRAGLANQKAKAIQGTLAAIHARFGDYTLDPLRQETTEDARAWLATLPGVGPKTANLVLCFALGRPAIPVDTHVHRVSWRVGLIAEGTPEVKAHELLERRVPGDLAYRFHISLIQHGRTICRAPLPTCEQCPLREGCRWYRNDGPERRRRQLARVRRKATRARREEPRGNA